MARRPMILRPGVLVTVGCAVLLGLGSACGTPQQPQPGPSAPVQSGPSTPATASASAPPSGPPPSTAPASSASASTAPAPGATRRSAAPGGAANRTDDTSADAGWPTVRDSIPSTGGLRLAPTHRTGPLRGRVVGIDPGHNGRQSSHPEVINRQVPAGNGTTKACNTTGTAAVGGYGEHAHNWDVAVRLTAQLRRQGATVVLTRPTDTGVGPCVNERAGIGNRARADLVVSIHADGNTSPSARGFHLITAARMAGGSAVERDSRRLAELIRNRYQDVTGMPRSTYTGGSAAITRRPDIAGLALSSRVAVMLEAGNLRHPSDAALLQDPRFRQREADALAGAIGQFLRS